MSSPRYNGSLFFRSRVAAYALSIAVTAGFAVPAQKKELDLKALTPSIETRLIELINEERARGGLATLTLSPELTELARSHCRDMAARTVLSHEATEGKPFSRRIVEAGVFFQKGGENIAYSESYAPEIIHQALMGSPEHREEILTPDYDRIGIGVVYAEKKGFYVTENFIRSYVLLTAEEAEEAVKKKINSSREIAGVSPLIFSSSADALARKYSEKKAAGQALPSVSDIFGETVIYSITAVSPDSDRVSPRDILSPNYEEAGVGVWFGRNEANPGGIYLFTFFLFPKNPYIEMRPEDLKGVVLERINRGRRDLGLKLLELNSALSKQADRVSRSHIEKKSPSPTALANLNGASLMVGYETENLSVMPEVTLSRLMSGGQLEIGIGLSFVKSPQFRRGVYRVTLIIK